MKKLILAFVAVTAVAALAGPPMSHTVGTNSVMVLPSRIQDSAPAWTTNVVYSQGAYVSHGGYLYWCQTASGGTNTASDAPAIDTTDWRSSAGTNTWQWIPSGRRERFAILNDSTNNLYISVGAPAVANRGIRLNDDGGSYVDIHQAAVYAVSPSEGQNLCSQEW